MSAQNHTQSPHPPTNFASGGDPGGVYNNYLVSAAKSAASGTWRRMKQHPFSAAGSTVVICLTLIQTITQYYQMQIGIQNNSNGSLTAIKYKDLPFPVDEEKLGESMEEVCRSVLYNNSNIDSLDNFVEEVYKIMELAIEEDPEAAKAALSPDSAASPENENKLKSREQFKAQLQKVVARRVGGA